MSSTCTPADPSIPFTKMTDRDVILRDLFDGLCTLFRPSVICDVGAFNGDESYRLAHLIPEAKVYAFEASPRNFQQFYVAETRFSDVANFTIEHAAVSDVTGAIQFNVLDATDASSDWRRAANSILSRTDNINAKTVSVPSVTLDTYFAASNIELNTFALWIDVEGALEKVLLGANNVLQRTLLIRTEVEWKELWAGQKMAPEMKTLIESKGFTVFGDTFVENAYDQSDVVFVNKNLLSLLASRGKHE